LDSKEFSCLQALLQQPTAPFREQQVIAEVERQLAASDIPHFHDEHGNLVVGVESSRAFRDRLRRLDSEPLRLFIAHMDHPGFHGSRWLDDRTLAVKWLGGSPVKHLRGARVWLGSSAGEVAEGRLTAAILTKTKRSIDTTTVRFKTPDIHRQFRRANRLHGGFSFRAPVWKRGKRLYARVADDLAGVHAIVETARRLKRRKTAARSFVGLLTRGEEVGFVGAVRHLEGGVVRQGAASRAGDQSGDIADTRWSRYRQRSRGSPWRSTHRLLFCSAPDTLRPGGKASAASSSTPRHGGQGVRGERNGRLGTTHRGDLATLG